MYDNGHALGNQLTIIEVRQLVLVRVNRNFVLCSSVLVLEMLLCGRERLWR